MNETIKYRTQKKSKFSLLNARSYSYTVFDYLPFDFWKFSMGTLVNMTDGSLLSILDVKHSLNDSSDIIINVKQPLGREGDEFGSDFYRFSDKEFFGYSQQFSLQYLLYF